MKIYTIAVWSWVVAILCAVALTLITMWDIVSILIVAGLTGVTLVSIWKNAFASTPKQTVYFDSYKISPSERLELIQKLNDGYVVCDTNMENYYSYVLVNGTVYSTYSMFDRGSLSDFFDLLKKD